MKDLQMIATECIRDLNAYKGKLEGHYAPVVCAKFLADSYMCASVDEEAVVKIWDTKQHQCLQSIAPDKKNLVINRLLYIKRYNRFVIYGNKMIFYDPKYRDSEVAKQERRLCNKRSWDCPCRGRSHLSSQQRYSLL